MRRLLAALTLLGITPTLALAAFLTPSELLFAESLKRSPYDTSYELHANVQNQYFVSGWVRGSGQMGDANVPTGTAHTTIDVVGPSFNVRTKWQMRAAGGMAYLLLERVEGSYDHELVHAGMNAAMKKWIAVPFEPMQHDDEDLAMGKRIVDAILTLTKKPAGASTQYSLTLNPNAYNTLVEILGEPAADEDMMRRLLREGTFTVDARADRSDRITQMSFNAAFHIEQVGIRAKGTLALRNQAARIDVPANVVSLEELERSMSFPLSDPWSRWGGLTEFDESEWDESERQVEETLEEDSGDPCFSDNPVRRLAAERVGSCSKSRPSRRSLNQRDF